MEQSDRHAKLRTTDKEWPGQRQTARAAQRRVEVSDAPATYPSEVGEGGQAERRHGRPPHSENHAAQLRLVSNESQPERCRSRGCNAAAFDDATGYCRDCQAVYDAAMALRARLLARRSARLRPRHTALLDALSPADRDRLLAHLAAHDAHHSPGTTGVAMAGLEDFLQELREIGLDPELLT